MEFDSANERVIVSARIRYQKLFFVFKSNWVPQ